MASWTQSVTVGPDHVIAVEPSATQTATVTVASVGSTVFYADQRYVTSTSNQGSIAPGASATFSAFTYMTAATYTSASIAYADAAPSFLSGVTIGEGGNTQHTAIFTPRNAILPEPVMTLQPVLPNLVCAMDIAPSAGATQQTNNGWAWIDVCDGPVQAANPYVGTSLRLGNGSTVAGSHVADVSTRKFGAGAIPLAICADWDGSSNPQIYITPRTATNPNVLLGYDGSDIFLSNAAAAVATNVTRSFVYFQNCAGTPTGVPAQAGAGRAPMIFDTTGLKLWAYTGGAWKSVTFA